MKTQLHGVLAVALSGFLAAGCATAAGSGETGNTAPAGERTVVEVTNHNWLDVNVYAERSGQRVRLGTVSSMTTETFRVPRIMVGAGEVRLVAAPIGSPREHRTDRIMVENGDRIEWNLENSLSLSYYAVRAAPR